MSSYEVLRDTINEVWEAAYPGSAKVDDLLALKMRVQQLAEDRANWVFNARVLQKQVNELTQPKPDAVPHTPAADS